MKIKKNRIFPYPIITYNNIDYNNSNFESNINLSFDYENGNAEFEVEIKVDDEVILNLLEKEKVGVFFHVECPLTKFRDVIEIKNLDKCLTRISIEKLNGIVEAICLLISKEEIIGYINKNLNELYQNSNINFPPFSIIGYTSTESFIVNKTTKIDGDIPSIFNIIKTKDNKNFVSFDEDSDKISIYIPEKEYDKYYDLKGRVMRIKQSILIIPVLAEILEKIKNDKDTDLETNAWYDVLEKRVQDIGYDGFGDRFKNESSFEIAQRMLGNVMEDAFYELETVFKKEVG